MMMMMIMLPDKYFIWTTKLISRETRDVISCCSFSPSNREHPTIIIESRAHFTIFPNVSISLPAIRNNAKAERSVFYYLNIQMVMRFLLIKS